MFFLHIITRFCAKAIDVNERLHCKGSRRFFKYKKRKDKRYLLVNGFLTEKEQTMKKKNIGLVDVSLVG